MPPPEQVTVALPGSRLHALAWGDPADPLVLCVPGLSAHAGAFAAMAPLLAAGGRRVVALDLRGRGGSPDTGPGTYGLDRHAADVLAAAAALGAQRFDWIGWSMGALVGILAAAMAPERIGRLGLLDAAGPLDDAALEAVLAALARLDAVFADPETYVAGVRDAGSIGAWSGFWADYFRAELIPVEGGWTPATSRAACQEDIEATDFGALEAAWPALTMPALLVRATRPLGTGFVVPEATRDAVRAAAADLEVAEVDADHYTVVTAPATADALVALLRR